MAKQGKLEHINESLRSLAVDVEELSFDPRNARKHPQRNLDAIKASLEAFGQQKPIVITTDGMVVAGNGLLEAARQLGWKHVAAVRVDKEHATAYGIADNRTGELSAWDDDMLRSLLTELPNVELVGFSSQELDAMTQEWVVPPAKQEEKDYSEDDETFVIKVQGVSRSDRDGVLAAMRDALVAGGFDYSCDAF